MRAARPDLLTLFSLIDSFTKSLIKAAFPQILRQVPGILIMSAPVGARRINYRAVAELFDELDEQPVAIGSPKRVLLSDKVEVVFTVDDR